MKLATIGLAALGMVLPPHCPGCDSETRTQGDLCAACFARAAFVIDPCCTRCAAPFASVALAGSRGLCEACLADPPDWDEARAAFLYDDFSRALILPLKYADRTENAQVLGMHMARAGGSLLEHADIVVPVPLHRWRLLSRRYNQAVLLGRAAIGHAARDRRLLLVDGLLRNRRTARLAHRNAVARLAEMDGAISVNPRRHSAFAGKRVVVVDDVLTTGATASACARALKRAGAASVGLLVAARTTREASCHERERGPDEPRFG